MLQGRRAVDEGFRLRPPLLGLIALAIYAGSSFPACGRKGDPVPPGLRLPGKPTKVRISGPGGLLELAWDAPREDLGGRRIEPPEGYRILRSGWPPGESPCDGCPDEWAAVATLDTVVRRTRGLPATAWVDPDLRPGWTFRYQVEALGPRGRSGPSSDSVQIRWMSIETPRANAFPGDREVLVRVDPPSWPEGFDPLGIRVYGDDGQVRAEGGADSLEAVVAGLPNGVEQELLVRLAARSPEGWVLEGREASLRATPEDRVPPVPPTDLVAFAEADGIRVRWLPAGPEPYATILLRRRVSGGPLVQIARLPGGSLTYLDTGVESGNVYGYSVTVVDAAGNESLPTREVRGRPR